MPCKTLRWLVWSLMLAGGLHAKPAATAAQPPRLAVLISIDQFRYDYLDRYAAVFGADGLRRLREKGIDFRDCHYRHGITKTAPGHALMLSGVHANVHAIVGNEWTDRTTWLTVNNVEDSAAPLVGAEAAGPLVAKTGRSPRNFNATTVGDELKLRNGANSRVVAVANKDRAAILMGGRLADAAYWVDRGRFVTSRYYRDALPEWVASFNAEGRPQKSFGQVWDRLLAPELYERLAGSDDVATENPANGLGRTFPRKIDGGKSALGNEFYAAYQLAPAYSELLAEFAKAAVRAEQLGRHAATDLLCIGFSQLDHVGHAFGPDSQEIMDTLVRLDRVVADLLRFFDAEVGAGNYVVVVTADHGVAPMPERLQAMNRDIDCGRPVGAEFTAAVEKGLTERFGPLPAPLYWVMRDGSAFHFRPEALQAKQLASAQAEEAARAVLLARPEMLAVYTRDDFLNHQPLDTLGEMMRLSFHPLRSPDVMYVLKPYWVEAGKLGSTHGTPFNYDTHVPLLWYGAGIAPAVHTEPVGVDDLAPTLSGILGLTAPPQAMGRKLF